MWKPFVLVLAVLALVGCSKGTSDAGKLVEATNCAPVSETCGVQIGPDGTELKITLPDGSHLSIFAGLKNAAGETSPTPASTTRRSQTTTGSAAGSTAT